MSKCGHHLLPQCRSSILTKETKNGWSEVCQCPGDRGYLIVSHSESLYQVTDRFELIGNTVYRKDTFDERGPHQTRAAASLPGYDKINRYWDTAHDMPQPKMLPGWVLRDQRCRTRDHGAQVPACRPAWDRVFGVGGMNHFMRRFHPMEKGGMDPMTC